MDWLRVVKGKRWKRKFDAPFNLIGAPSAGAAMLRQKPDDPLPLCQLIFLNSHDNICAWFHANKGHDPLHLMVLELRREYREDRTKLPSLPMGGIHCLTATSGMSGLEVKNL